MRCFIGGSGSTGSSVLANVLNRHSEVFCGPESYLFTKHQLFTNWKDSKADLLDGKLKSFPWHMYSKVELLNEAYEWEWEKLQELVSYSNFIEEFAEEFFRTVASKHGKSYWIEKTPSNVYGFKYLLDHFPNCFLIHTIRNPYDTIASLNRRGFSIYYATCLYLVNTCVGLAMRNEKHYIPVVYEDLVTHPSQELKKVCDLLGIAFEPSMLVETAAGFDEDIDSWGLSEHGRITDESIGTFNKVSRFVQEEIIYTVNSLRLTPFYAKEFGCDIVDIPGICDLMDFAHYDDGGFMNIFQLNIDKSRDHLTRIIRGYPSKLSKYPVMFRV
ncbi:sulfotransferase family protein [Portibacter lacus]|uniref:Sulfotransferase n=1 Tax=Portibacter lacus TaxID=1099794 RepID=A0AA37SU77_9BACT|nr:sulfotransferase [Portibacter lacus]GLR18288.1 hypothetical protein GCM10007940_29040 [Portibacter lacus]